MRAWKKMENKENQTVGNVSPQPIMNVFNARRDKGEDRETSKIDIAQHIKKRTSSRTSSLGNKLKMTTMRSKMTNGPGILKEKELGGSLRRIQKPGSIRFQGNAHFEAVSVEKTVDRNSTASNSVDENMQQSKGAKRSLRMKHLRAGKIT